MRTVVPRGMAPAGDLAAQLYLALSSGAGAVEEILDGADAEALRRVSEWRERRPPAEGKVPTGEEPYATRGFTALHVLAADCTDAAVLGRAIDLAGAAALATAGGFYAERDEAAGWRPIHSAAANSSSPEVVQKLLDAGGLEQLQAKDSKGECPFRGAVQPSQRAMTAQLRVWCATVVPDILTALTNERVVAITDATMKLTAMMHCNFVDFDACVSNGIFAYLLPLLCHPDPAVYTAAAGAVGGHRVGRFGRFGSGQTQRGMESGRREH